MKTPNGPTKSELNNYYNIETKANEESSSIPCKSKNSNLILTS